MQYFVDLGKEQPLVFFNQAMKYGARGLRATHWKDAVVMPAPNWLVPCDVGAAVQLVPTPPRR